MQKSILSFKRFRVKKIKIKNTFIYYYLILIIFNLFLNLIRIKMSDRIGTIAMNTYRHFELYFGISC